MFMIFLVIPMFLKLCLVRDYYDMSVDESISLTAIYDVFR